MNASGKGMPILIVDDERCWLHTLSLALRSRGHCQVEVCQQSTEVLDLLGQQQYSLVLLDLVMPQMSGSELLPLIREKYPDLPVIILSGLLQNSDTDWCKALGAFGQCIKTDPRETLFGLVDQALSA